MQQPLLAYGMPSLHHAQANPRVRQEDTCSLSQTVAEASMSEQSPSFAEETRVLGQGGLLNPPEARQ